MNLVQEYIKVCPECEQEYQAHRLNQHYCSVRCKTRFNNRKARQKEEQFKSIQVVTNEVNTILWKNRLALQAFAGQEISLEEVQEHGFQLNYITFFDQNKKGENRFYCYDYSYKFIDPTTIKISQK